MLDLTEKDVFCILQAHILGAGCSGWLIWLLEGQWKQFDQYIKSAEHWNCMERQNDPTILESVTDTEISGNPCTRTSKMAIRTLPNILRFLFPKLYTYLQPNLTGIWVELPELGDILHTKSLGKNDRFQDFLMDFAFENLPDPGARDSLIISMKITTRRSKTPLIWALRDYPRNWRSSFDSFSWDKNMWHHEISNTWAVRIMRQFKDGGCLRSKISYHGPTQISMFAAR